jgi:hypothetical protein
MTHPAIASALAWATTNGSFQELDPFEYREGHIALCSLFRGHVRGDDYYSVLAGANAVYGWMPTILKKGVSKPLWSKCQNDLEALRSTSSWPIAQSIILENPDILRLVNGSLVGSSKFLHFLNPEVLPIWDSHIARVFNAGRKRGSSDVEVYVAYAATIWDAIESGLSFPQSFLDFVGVSATPIRRLELLLFLHGQNLRKEGSEA